MIELNRIVKNMATMDSKLHIEKSENYKFTVNDHYLEEYREK